MSTPDSPHVILGIPENATEAQIKSAYRRLALKYHPDKCKGKTEEDIKVATAKFTEISNAYEALMNPQPSTTSEDDGYDTDDSDIIILDPFEIFQMVFNLNIGRGRNMDDLFEQLMREENMRQAEEEKARANAWKQIDWIKALPYLPYIRDFKCTQELLEIILHEYHVAADFRDLPTSSIYLNELHEYAREASTVAAIKEFLDNNKHRGVRTPFETPKFGKHLHDYYDGVVAETTKMIKKHFRKESIKIHPDRFGDEYRDEFEALTNARDCLIEPELRRGYIDQMLDCVVKLGSAITQVSHDAWVNKYRPDRVDEKNKPSKQKKEKRYLQGGLMNDRPGRVEVTVIDQKLRKIQLALPILKPDHEFFTYCISIHVLGSCPAIEDQKNLAILSNEEFKQLVQGTKIIISIELPVHSTWSFTWYGSLRIGDEVITTPISEERELDLPSMREISLRNQRETLPKLVDRAFRRAAEINSLVNRWNAGSQSLPNLEVDERYQVLHSLMVKGRTLLKTMEQIAQATSHTDNSEKAMLQLGQALDHTDVIFNDLKVERERRDVKGAKKNFKRQIADILESGNSPRWMETVTEEDLRNLQGDSNRLFQLYVEGKGVFLLELDPNMLEVAASRNDLFSDKQRESLLKRKEEIEAQAIAEDKKAEEEKNLAASRERERKEIELNAKKALIGTSVTFCNLKKEVLNGTFGTIVDVSTCGERFIVHSYELNKEISVLLEKFNKYYGYLPFQPPPGLKVNNSHYVAPPPKEQEVENKQKKKANNEKPSAINKQPWNCVHCTFKHDGADAELLSCKLCSNERDLAEEEKTKNKTYAGKISKADDSNQRESKNKIWNKEAPLPPNLSFLDDQHSVSQRSADNNSSASRRRRCRDGPQCFHLKKYGNCKFYHDPEEIEIASRPRRCRNGPKCRDLKTDQCKYYHPPEEIEAANEKPVTSPPVTAPKPVSVPVPAPAPKQPKHGTPVTSEPTVFTESMMVKTDLIKQIISRLQSIAKMTGVRIQCQSALGGMALVKFEAKDGLALRNAVDLVKQSLPKEKPSPVSLKGGISNDHKSENSIPAMVTVSSDSGSGDANSTTNSTLDGPLGGVSGPDGGDGGDDLLSFLEANAVCLKGSPSEFYQWLKESEDISTVTDLAEAIADETYLRECLQNGDGNVGLKGFKRGPFKKAVIRAASGKQCSSGGNSSSAATRSVSGSGASNSSRSGTEVKSDPPPELFCPISHELMTNDPVLASDGATYERTSIENWFRTMANRVALAKQELRDNPNSKRARDIVNSGVYSPMNSNVRMPNFNLVPNIVIRNMARDYARDH